MALQVEDALSGNVAEFSRFDHMEGVFTRTKASEPVAASGIARVKYSELIPPAKFDLIINLESLTTLGRAVPLWLLGRADARSIKARKSLRF